VHHDPLCSTTFSNYAHIYLYTHTLGHHTHSNIARKETSTSSPEACGCLAMHSIAGTGRHLSRVCSPCLRFVGHQAGVACEEALVPPRRHPGRPLLGVEVDVVEAVSQAVTERPLEVVQERPHEVAPHVCSVPACIQCRQVEISSEKKLLDDSLLLVGS